MDHQVDPTIHHILLGPNLNLTNSAVGKTFIANLRAIIYKQRDLGNKIWYILQCHHL